MFNTINRYLVSVAAALTLVSGLASSQNPKKPEPAKPAPAKPAPDKGGDKDKQKPKDGAPEKAKPDNQQKPKAAKDEYININGELYTKEEKEKLDKGWKRLDYDWISPEDVPNVDKGLFKVEGKWLTIEEADKYHSNEETPWIIPKGHFAFTSNISRAQIMMLSTYAETSYNALKDLLGAEPKGRLGMRIFNNVESANGYAQEYVKGERESHHSSVWLAYIGDGEKERPGVILFDGEPGKGFAHIYMGHAAAHKFIDATFPDPDTIPEWFVEGLATYCERYLDGSLRQWALQMLIKRGGIDKLSTFSKNFKITAEDPDKSQAKLQQAALIIAYYVLGLDKQDEAAFKKAVATLPKTKDAREAAIEKLLDNPDALEKKIKKYAGL